MTGKHSYGSAGRHVRVQKKRRKLSRLSNAMIFILVFIVFLMVFGVMCIWMAVQMNQRSRESEISGESTEPQSLFDDTDIRNTLLILADEGDAVSFTLVRSDPARGAMRAVAFPPDTVVDSGTREALLNAVYREGGAPAARDALGGLTGIAFDNYAVLSYNNISNIITEFGHGLIYTLDENVKLDGKTMYEGKNSYAPSQVNDLLRYQGWTGGKRHRARTHAGITAAFINQYMVPSALTPPEDGEGGGDKWFTVLINNFSQTDILISHYNSAHAGLAELAVKNKSDICRTDEAPGAYTGSGEALRFYTEENLQETLAGWFSD